MSNPVVAVAMSGGVDSSLACALLLEKGFRVFGITMRIPVESKNAEAAAQDAKKVCDRLGVPHYLVDLTCEFEKEVVSPFVEAYSRGITPNPCVICNPRIKFGHLLERSLGLGAEYLATGHYARAGRVDLKTQELVENHVVAGLFKDHSTDDVERSLSSRTYLARGKDKGRDQSYVLYGLDQNMLRHAMFPLGNLTKSTVREMAKDIGLDVAEKPESQEICFIAQKNYKEFLRHKRVSETPGLIVDTSGRVLGRHNGIVNYTVGQRKGLGIESTCPLYVIHIDAKENKIVVGRREEAYASACYIGSLNFIMVDEPDSPVHGTCMVRYRGQEVEATLYPRPFSPQKFDPIETGCGVVLRESDVARVEFSAPLFAVTPGQSLVFYQGSYVYGGGTILETVHGTSLDI